MAPRILAFVSALSASVAFDGARAQTGQDDLPTLGITVFAAPSQSIWIPTIIQGAGFDRAHGFELEVTAKPSRVAYSDFSTGADPVCFCAAPAAVSRFVQEGADITLLWNVFSSYSLISFTSPDIDEPKDLEGRTLAADTATGSWAIAQWWLQQHDVDLSKVEIQSSSSGGIFAQLTSGRVDAAFTNPANASTLATTEGAEGVNFLILDDEEIWSRYSDVPGIPSIAFGVWREWLEDPEHVDLAQRFYAANLDAVELIRTDPQRAAELVSEGTSLSVDTLVHNFTTFPDIIDVRPIDEVEAAIRVITTQLLPEAGILPRPLSEEELDRFISDFQP